MAFSRACVEKPHRIHVAEVVGIQSTGKIVVITVCLDCGEVNFTEHVASASNTPLRLLKEEKEKTK